MNQVALFERALRAAVPTQPDPAIGDQLVPRLAGIARLAALEAQQRGGGWRRALRGGRTGSRRGLVARVGIAIAAIPLLCAGLAFAGVTLPAPARDAFDSVGISLPNQPSEQSAKSGSPTSQGGGNDVSDAAKAKNWTPSDQGNSTAAHEHARQQRSKARGDAKGHTIGKAIGLNELAPPGQLSDAGPPDHSSAGGSARSQATPRANPTPLRGGARSGSKQPSRGGSNGK